ncbi:MAG: DPP IV N-terminal domain-containing protein [Tepidisphaeraceae bacterium]|jgi:TolB protein
MKLHHGNFARLVLCVAPLFIWGCSGHSSPRGSSDFAALSGGATAGADRPMAAPDAAPDSADAKATPVNVFGEFDGVQRTLAHAYGDAGFQQHTFLEEGYDSDVNIDPTGKWMVFTSTRHSEHPNLYLQRVDGMSVIQLSNDEADYAYPTFSPDGRQIAFSSTRGGNWDIYLMDIDGKNIVQVTSGPMQHVHPSFSPDGTRLVYSSLGSKSGQWELWTVDLNSGEKRMIGFGLFPSWSPAKGVDRIAFQRARQRGSRWFSLWTLDLADGEAHRVTEIAVSTNSAIVSPTWSNDGKQLAFATIAEPTATTGIKPAGQQDIWAVNADGTNRRRLTDGIGMNLGPAWSSDGRVYFISDRCGSECIWSVKLEGAGSKDKVAQKTTGQTLGDAN